MIPLRARLAFRYLTILPAPYDEGEAAARLSDSLPWFPVVGLVVGAAGAALLSLPLPALPRAALALAAGVVLTRGLHEDGVMDVADAAIPPVSRERSLEILSDPHVGAHGVTVAIVAMVLRFAALSAVPATGPVVAGIASRWCVTLAIGRWPPARPGGLGARFHHGATTGPATLVALGLLAATAAVASTLRIVAAAIAALLAGTLTAVCVARRLGGLNGDAYGAVQTAAEIAALFAYLGSP